MGIRKIKNKAGQILGFQALKGSGAAGDSRYFGVAKHESEEAALLAARLHADSIKRQHPSRTHRAQRMNRNGVAGLRFRFMQHGPDSTPIRYVVATWRENGRNRATAASTEKHGLLGAIELMLKARQTGLRQSLGLMPRQALVRMKAAEQ